MRFRTLNFENILLVWLVLLAVMLISVLAKRDIELDKLASDVTVELKQCYSTGKVDHGTYTGGWSTPSLQGSAVYLLERGRRYPKMERELLIAEALRTYDWKYIYSHCWNYDLRMLLIDRCRMSFPDDAEVAWASGRILLTAGHYAEAIDELERASQLGLDYDKPWINEKHVRGRLLAALLMEGRVDEWEYYLLEQANADKQDEGKAYRYINALLVQGKYDQALLEIENREATFDVAQGYSMLKARGLFWSGRQSDFEEFIDSGLKNATLSQSTKEWASALVSTKPPEPQTVLLLEEIQELTTRLEHIDRQYDAAYNKDGWKAARPFYDQLKTIRQTKLPFEVNSRQTDNYAINSDPIYVDPILKLLIGLKPVYENDDWETTIADTNRIWRESLNYLGRCFVMSHEWGRLKELHESTADSEGISSMKTSYKLLAVITSGKPIAYAFNDQGYYRNTSFNPALTATAEFKSALAFSGRDFDEVVAEIAEETRPFRQSYNDYSNETLKIPWVKLAETDRYSWED